VGTGGQISAKKGAEREAVINGKGEGGQEDEAVRLIKMDAKKENEERRKKR